MTEQEKVIKALECCISDNPGICKRRGCPYADEHEGVGDTCIDHVMADALALLKAQEPVKPKKRDADFGNLKSGAWICGVCGADMIWGRRYCPDCGRVVKWNG